jgi:hypothetical protein
MNDDIKRLFPEAEPPAAATIDKIAKIAAQFAASATPLRPLPSNLALWAIGFTIFALLALVVAKLVGLKAVAVLSGDQMVIYYGVLLLFAALFSRALIERMIPASKRVVPSTVLSIAALVVLGLLAAVLFADHGTRNFVSQGIPCLSMGVVSALIGGFLGWRLLQRGYLVSPRETISLYGFFAGLLGVTVLALHCPILNSLHVLVWHLGAMLLAGLAGFLWGSYAD